MNFYQTINAAIDDIELHGFDTQQRINNWMEKIEAAAKEAMIPESSLRNMLANTLGLIYQKAIEKGGILKLHPGIARFKLEQLKPRLRAQLDRRIMASANLIELNRQQSIAKTLQRFSGWSTSIPAGGSDAIDKTEVKEDLKKALKSLPYEERRVSIDQGHKLLASLNDVIASDEGAIAAEWHSHFRQPGYDYREDHKERDGNVYMIRGNWAQQNGLVKAGKSGYTDEITMVAEEPFCRCSYRYLYSIKALPDDMLTAKGRASLEQKKYA